MNHTSAHVARAVLEGCAYALRDIVDRLDALGLGRGEVRIVGGGARDDLWAAIKASVLGRPVRRVLTEEATAVGAAMVAGVGAGFFARFHCGIGCRPAGSGRPSTPTPRRPRRTRTPIGAISPHSTPSSQRWRPTCRPADMITVPDPLALLADLRAEGHADAARRGRPHRRRGVGRRDRRQRRTTRTGGEPVILSDGGPYRTPAGPVVDRLAEQLGDCPVVQLGTGTVRADEETVERAVAEVGADRLLISVGRARSPTSRRSPRSALAAATSRSKPPAASTVSSPTAASSSSPGAKRTVESRWPDVLVADSRHPDRGTARS